MKKKVLIVFVAFLFIASAVIGGIYAISKFDKQFIIKDEKITAAYLETNEVFSANDSEDVFKVKVKEAVAYFKENGINTVILPFNENDKSISEIEGFINIYSNTKYFDKKDIVKKLKAEFAAEKIQLILSLNCDGFLDSEVEATIAQINKQYALAGLLLTNYTSQAKRLEVIKTEIDKKHPDFYLAIEKDIAEDIIAIQETGAVDLFILNKIDEQEYRRLKSGILADSTVLLSYKTEKFLSDLFIISNFSQLDGVVLTQYADPNTDLGIYKNMVNTEQPLQVFNFTVPTDFAVGYPKGDISTYYGGIFITGSSSPEQMVYVNGNEVAPAKDGTFGYYIELAVGDNIIKVEQNSDVAQFNVTRKVYSSSGGGTKPTFDSTQEASKGQKVKTVGPLTSIITNLHDDSSIMDGVAAGTILQVESSEVTTRGGRYTYAYKLANGAYVLAKNVQWISEDNYTRPVIENISAEILENGDEYLNISNVGKPAVLSIFDDEKVQFIFLNTDFADDLDTNLLDANNQKSSNLIDVLSIEKSEDNTVITLHEKPDNGIWGYNIETNQDGVTKIYLKKTPKKAKGEKPLAGITILLDAGHGFEDTGAPAVGGISGPVEKDLNLAVSIATKACLEKMGATVYMTREDDTFLTLDERRDLVNELKPDLFIAQHHNSLDMSADGSVAFGTEVYYFTGQSKPIAEALVNEISELTGRKNRGEKFGYFYVTRTDIAPSVLAEYGFVVNPYEYSNLYSDIDIYKAAFGTAKAVLEVIPE